MAKFKEYTGLNLSNINKDVLERWQQLDVFHKSIETREGKPSFVFYEGPPSANFPTRRSSDLMVCRVFTM